jgi:hypothetical protein
MTAAHDAGRILTFSFKDIAKNRLCLSHVTVSPLVRFTLLYEAVKLECPVRLRQCAGGVVAFEAWLSSREAWSRNQS